ncbi:STAS domain-containing protein [Streptomyces lavendulae]|uniref:STAS domain-containing protein n=1 Tax=Streptomyces lavendulae TaxID=1914 RepID=UPI003674039C
MTGIMYADRLDTAAADRLKIHVTPGPSPGTVNVCVSGEIDFDNAAVLRATLVVALTSQRTSLLMDLSRVAFCDCAGLNALLTARLAAEHAGRHLRITAASRSVNRLLSLTGTRPFLT